MTEAVPVSVPQKAVGMPSLNEPDPVKVLVEDTGDSILTANGRQVLLEVRSLRDKEREVPFSFLVIDKPEKWLQADDFSASYTLNRPNSATALKFKVRPFSLEEWEAVENDIPLPELELGASEADANESERYKTEKEQVLTKRKAFFLEAGTGMKIPGETLDAKVQWLNKRGQGEIDALYDYLTDDLSGFRDGHLLDLYNSISLSSEKRVVTEVTSFDDWATASDVELVYRCHRPTEKFIMEFPLRGLSVEDKRQLDNDTKEPIPPKIPSRTPEGRFDPSKMVDDFKDYGYRQRFRAYVRKQLVMLIEAVLLFKIPGVTAEDKYEWLGKRPVGDVVKLRNFIQNQLISYKKHYESFI